MEAESPQLLPVLSQINPVTISIPLPENPVSYYPPTYDWVFQVASFLQVSPPKPSIQLSCPPYVLRAPPISFV